MDKVKLLALLGFVLIAFSFIGYGYNIPTWIETGMFAVVNAIWLLIAYKEENYYLLVGSLLLLFLTNFPIPLNPSNSYDFLILTLVFFSLILFGVGLYNLNSKFAQWAGLAYIFASTLMLSLKALAAILFIIALFFEGLALLDYSKVRKIRIPIKFLG